MHVQQRVRGIAAATTRRGAMLLVSLAAALTLVLALASAAFAGPVTDLSVVTNTSAAPGSTLQYFVWISNVGDVPTTDSDADGVADVPRTLVVTMPPGITIQSAIDQSAINWDCSSLTPGDSTMTCTNPSISDPHSTPTRNDRMLINANVDGGAAGLLTARFHVSGGGAAPASAAFSTDVTLADPEFGITAFDGQVAANAAGDPFTQAGGHPYSISTALYFGTTTNPIKNKGATWPVEPVKDISVDLPPGLIGSPTATGDARCTLAQLAVSEQTVAKPLCPPGSQIGVSKVFTADGWLLSDPLPVFNMVAPTGVPARFGLNVSGTVVTMDAALRSEDNYAVTVNLKDVSEGLAIAGTELTFWGVPADPSHDPLRACPGQQAPGEGGPSCTTELAPKAFLRNPTSCTPNGVGLETTAHIDSWFDPGDVKAASFISHLPPAFPFPTSEWGAPQGATSCGDVPFEPTFSASPATSSAAGEPSGFAFDLSLPQSDDPAQIGTSDLKKAVVTLPAGLRVSPSSAGGLGACAPGQIQLHSQADPTCPSSSKIGTITIDTPLLDEPLEGAIYLAKPHDNPFDSLLSLYLVAKGPGVVVKLPGSIVADDTTGQLSATFDNNPQLPFANLHLQFKGGSRAPLSNPPRCGTYTTHAVLTSWSGRTVVSDSSFDVSRDGNGTPCGPAQFSPSLSAGVDSVKAGGNSSFDLRLTRDDQDQEFRSLTVTTPKGLLAKVAGVPLCPAAEAAAGTCAESSRVGSVVTGAGAGTNPFYLPGRVYLTGPYKGGPFGLSIVVPAVAGPFDLGTVVVRTSIQIDRHTAQLRVVSDPLPRILQGIALQIRDVRVTIDRPKFMVNPTNCAQTQVTAAVSSTDGLSAHPADRFQVGGCSKLRLAPKMSLSVGGKGHTRPGTSTPLKAVLTQTPGQASLKSVSVTLPLALNALLDVVSKACTQEQYEAGHCESARAGSATAITPLLDHGLRGGVYFVKDPQKPRGSLPNLVVALRGQVDFDLIGTITIPEGKLLATEFKAVPDVPIKRFVLSLVSGSHGPVGVVDNLCSAKAKRQTAAVVFRGQNGAVITRNQRLHVSGCGRSHH